MKFFAFLNPPDVFVEIGQDSLRVVHENENLEWPLERLSDGRLTAAGKEKLTSALKKFLPAKNWQPRPRAICAINARGVSLRKLSLPAGAKDEFQKRLQLQIESEFPLPPDELAWGCQLLGAASATGALAKQDWLVAAVKKEVVADYQEVFLAAGANPIFTLAVLAQNQLCPPATEPYAILEMNPRQAELTRFENGVPVFSRIIFWNGDEAELAKAIKTNLAATKLFISGNEISENFAVRLAESLGAGWKCERLKMAAAEKNSAVILGLKKLAAAGGPPLVIRVRQIETAVGAAVHLTAPDLKKWLARAAALAVILLLLPYVEALLLQPHLARTVAAYQNDAGRLETIDRELDFLRYLKQNQPPYLDALYIFSKSVSPGARFDSISMDGHGEVSLRGSFQDGRQVTDFRSRLIDSGVFTNVTVEDQSPAPHGRQVDVRMTAQWKSGATWPVVSEAPPPGKIENHKTGNAGKTNLNSPKSASAPAAGKEAVPAHEHD